MAQKLVKQYHTYPDNKGKDIMRWLFAFDFHKYSELVNIIPKP